MDYSYYLYNNGTVSTSGTTVIGNATWTIYPPDSPPTAGVREPRRPLPVAPSTAAEIEVRT